MATLMQRAFKQTLRPTILAHRGVEVTFQRADGTLPVITVNPARTTEEMESEQYVHRGEKLQDFIVDAEEFAGVEPRPGESFVWDDKRFLFTHRVGGRLFDYHDSYRDSYRCHTIEVPLESQPIPPPIEPPPIDPPPVDPDVSAYANATDFYGGPHGDAYAPPGA